MENLKQYRISLKFSERDPDQAEVAKLLKQLGRKKSSFITKAIKYYLENNPYPEIPGNNNALTKLLTENMIKNAIMSMIKSGELSYNITENINKEPKAIKEEKVIEKEPEPVITETKISTDSVENKKDEKEIVSKEKTQNNIKTNPDVDDMLSMLQDAFG